MSNDLHAALRHYRTVLLETAAGDLFVRVADLPLPNAREAATASIDARREVLRLASKVSAERFTAEVMAAGFTQ